MIPREKISFSLPLMFLFIMIVSFYAYAPLILSLMYVALVSHSGATLRKYGISVLTTFEGSVPVLR